MELSFLFGLLKVDTTLARINEPSVGGDCNVYTKIDGTGVLVIAERNIFAEGNLHEMFLFSVTYASINRSLALY